MKLKGASAYTCLVSDIEASVAFYEKLGLEAKSKSATRAVIYINWYRIDLVKVGSEDSPELLTETALENKGAGVYLYFSVDNVDETCAEMLTLGLKPDGEPKDEPWGNREFIIRDPDGYKLVIFKRQKLYNPLN